MNHRFKFETFRALSTRENLNFETLEYAIPSISSLCFTRAGHGSARCGGDCGVVDGASGKHVQSDIRIERKSFTDQPTESPIVGLSWPTNGALICCGRWVSARFPCLSIFPSPHSWTVVGPDLKPPPPTAAVTAAAKVPESHPSASATKRLTLVSV